MSVRSWIAAVLAGAVLLAPAASRAGATGSPPVRRSAEGLAREPMLLEADRLRYDFARRVVTAEGRVRLESAGHVLTADRLVYDARADLVRAEGRVTLATAGGQVFYGEKVELTGDLREGFVRHAAARLDGGARLAANLAIRLGGRTTILERAVFSSCPVACPNGRPPLWRLRAARVIHDAERRTLTYEEVVLELGGVPVLWLPRFSHPDPTVERRTGFLVPDGGTDTELGLWLRTPFFVVLAPNRDLTLTPMLATSQGAMLRAELRDLETFGLTELGASLAWAKEHVANPGRPRKRTLRGHLEGRGRYAVRDEDRFGFDFALASDDTYLDTFRISDEDVLESRLFYERFDGRDFLGVETVGFQGLRPGDDQGRIPVATPAATVHLRRALGMVRGASWTFDGDLLILSRRDGLDTRRLVGEGGLEWSGLGRFGDLWRLRASLRGDLYWIDGDPATLGGGPERTAARLVPQFHAGWSWPLVTTTGRWSHLVEPSLAVTVGTVRDSDDPLPNEDSLSFEFDETNLFAPTRFSGFDRVERGLRLAWGVRFESVRPGGLRIGGTLGQVIRPDPADVFPRGSGLEGTFSDLVGRLDLRPHDWLEATYRFRLHLPTSAFRRNDVAALLGPSWLRLRLNYVELSDEPAAGFTRRREQLLAGLRLAPSARFALGGQIRYDFRDDELLSWSAGFVWRGACLSLTAGIERRFTSRGELRDETTFRVRLGLAGLGGEEAGGDCSGGRPMREVAER